MYPIQFPYFFLQPLFCQYFHSYIQAVSFKLIANKIETLVSFILFLQNTHHIWAHHIWYLQYLSDWPEISIRSLLHTYKQTDPENLIFIGS